MSEHDTSTGADLARHGELVGAQASRDYVQRRTQDGIAILSFAGPDGNRMGAGLIADIDRAVARALGDDGVRALVLTARGADFCAGPSPDLPAPGPSAAKVPAALEALCALCQRIESSPKPVVCALHGTSASGGLALALAAQARVADARSVLHVPDLRLGLLPPGQGAVRLTWQVGLEEALDMVLNATPKRAPQLRELFTHIVDEALLPTAISVAERLAQTDARDRAQDRARPGLTDSAHDHAVLQEARVAPNDEDSTLRNVALDILEAAQLLPADQALAFDLVRAQDAATSAHARALAHLTRATRRALDTPEARRSDLTPLHAGPVLVALAPERAARLVPALLRAGDEVLLSDDLNGAALGHALHDALDAADLGAEGDFAKSLILHVAELGAAPLPALALCDPPALDALDTYLPRAVPIALWSPEASGLPPLTHPERAVEIVPAPTRPARLCEVVVHAETRPDAVHEVTQLMARLHLTPLRVGAIAALPRLIRALALAARRLRALGVDESTLAQIAILPEGLAHGESAPEPAPLAHAPERLIALAVINAGAHLLEDGVSLRPSDIDLAMVLGAGWPKARGGPMAEADTLGPLVVQRELKVAAALDPDLWTPAAMFGELVRQGWRFEDLNTG